MRLTKEEFLDKNKEFIEKYAQPVNGSLYVTGCIGNKEDCEKANFNGVYALIKDNEVFYVGSCFSVGRTIGLHRFNEHRVGNHTNSCVVSYFKDIYNLDTKQARVLFNTLEFIAFKFDSLEDLIMNNTPGLINSAGYKK